MILSQFFKNDIYSKDTNLVPLVVIEQVLPYVDDGTPRSIILSTNSISVNTSDIDGDYGEAHYEPLLLNIPSINQSVDIENRRFKISSVTLSISNFEYDSKRFSDLLQTSSMINKNVSIYWKSPTTEFVATPTKILDWPYTSLAEFFLGTEYSCPIVYSGKIRRVNHDSKKVTITVEDDSERHHKELPVEFIDTHDGILEKYRNKPKPMVYGIVDKSPMVVDGSEGGYTGVIDYKILKVCIK